MRSSDERMSRIDPELAELLESNSFRDTATLPVVVRAPESSLPSVELEIRRLGGRTRSVLARFGAIAAWLPINGIASLAGFDGVSKVSLEERCTIA